MEGSVDYEHLIRYLKDGRLVRKLRTENSQLKREVARLRKENRQNNRQTDFFRQKYIRT